MMKRASWKRPLQAVGVLALALMSTAATVADPVSGRTFGAWNLPRGTAHPGFAAGSLVDGATGRVVFRMRASLTEGPSAGLLRQHGTINGRLFMPTPSLSSVGGYPIYAVSGTWSGNRFTGEGEFEAYISVQRSPSGPTILIGKMGGRYADGLSFMHSTEPSLAARAVGRFKGRWSAKL